MSGRMAVVWNHVVPLKTRSKSTVGSGDLRQIFNIWRSLTHFPVSDGLVKLRTCSTRGLYILVQYEGKISSRNRFLLSWNIISKYYLKIKTDQGYLNISGQKRSQLSASQKVGRFWDFTLILHQNVELTYTTSSELYKFIGHREVGQRALNVENLTQVTRFYYSFWPCFERHYVISANCHLGRS